MAGYSLSLFFERNEFLEPTLTVLQRIVVSVINDLVTDQRVHKICTALFDMGFEVVLIGRKLPHSKPIDRNYKTIRMRLLFRKKFLFYVEYHFRLFIKLFFIRKDILLANDLDTLLPNFLISKLFGKKLVYDSHELFTEIAELNNRPTIRKVWLTVEESIFPTLKNVYTVNDSIAVFYQKKYAVAVSVIKNIAPVLTNKTIDVALAKKIKGNQKMLILQGSGINMERGAEEAIQMMLYLEDTILYIIGGGDIFENLKELANTLNLHGKVYIKDKMPYEELMEYTKIADLGLSLDKGTNLNYEYSLPNKIFDYIQAQIPVLASNRKEVAKLVNSENIGLVIDSHKPKALADAVKRIFADTAQYATWKKNLQNAANRYHWEKEREKLNVIYQNLS